MNKSLPALFHEFETALISILNRMHDHSQKCLKQGQPFGVCTVTPKNSSVSFPSETVQKDLQKLATEYFQTTSVSGYYLKYWTPPIPLTNENILKKSSANDYQMTFATPQFDEEWQKARLARDLIYCPSDEEWGEDVDWFEIQMEAIRLTPLLHQSLEECKILTHMHIILGQPGFSIFEKFIYEYGLKDTHFPPMNHGELEKWKTREIDWKIRYELIASLFPLSASLKEIYVLSREKATSSRNPMIKDLLWEFIRAIENDLILNTSLPNGKKKQELSKLRSFKQRPRKKEKNPTKRPALCISDIECASVLYFLCTQFLEQKQKSVVLAEGILFIWIAQHAAFSELHLKVENILSIELADINFQYLTITIGENEVFLTQGLMDVLYSWISTFPDPSRVRFFQKLKYDNLEELLSKYTSRLFGEEHKLLPKDFLEKVHVIPGARIPLELRRKIAEQESLIKNSPYLIKSQEIKRQIKQAIQQKSASIKNQ